MKIEDVRQKALMLERQIASSNNRSENDKVWMIEDSEHGEVEPVIRRVFDAAEATNIIKDLRSATDDRDLRVGIVDAFVHEIKERRVALTDDARTLFQNLARQLEMGSPEFFNPDQSPPIAMG